MNAEALIPRTGTGWSRGLRPLLRREMARWWRSRRWLVQSLIWTLLLDGLLFIGLFIMPRLTNPDGTQALPEPPLEIGLQMFFGLGLLALGIGVVVLMQDAVIGEKENGTLAWLLSKPLSRPAYVIAKLLPNLLGMLVTMGLVPSLVAFLLFRIYDPDAVGLLPFLAAEGIVLLHTLFYLTLSLFLGVLLEQRALLLGICLASILGGSLIPIPFLSMITPWGFGNIVLLPFLDVAVPGYYLAAMLGATALWSVFFILGAVVTFRRYQF